MNKNSASNQRTPEEYLQLPYTIEVHYDNSGDPPGWVAQVLELPGCITQADTLEELGEMIEEAMLLWIETELEDGEDIPEPRSIDDFSGRFVVRMPGSIHRDLVRAAEREGVSLNAYINSVLAREVGRIEVSSAQENLENPPDPRPAWDRLSKQAYRALVSAGLEIEAKEINEELFSRWLERNIGQVDASLKSGHVRDAEYHLMECQRALELCGRSSPLMAIFSQTTQMLIEQIGDVVRLREGIIEQKGLQTRISSQVERSGQSKFLLEREHFYRTEDTIDSFNIDEILKSKK